LAHYSHRTAASDELVLLGETQEYEPLSRSAYFKAMKEEKIKKAEEKNGK
jgi:thymidine kinase